MEPRWRVSELGVSECRVFGVLSVEVTALEGKVVPDAPRPPAKVHHLGTITSDVLGRDVEDSHAEPRGLEFTVCGFISHNVFII